MVAARHVIDRKHFPGGRPRLSRREALGRVMSCIEHRERAPATLYDICEAAGVSPRTLRTMFMDVFGVTPSLYLRVRRLHHLRTALLLADPTLRTVVDLCLQFQFTDAGRVARDYKALFDELPSQTLARRLHIPSGTSQ